MAPLDANPDQDPNDWSIDRVIQEVCLNPRPVWFQDTNSSRIPDAAALEQVLRDNHVDGDVLLSIDMQILREDLGIKSLGQRRAILKTIDHLRGQSQKYRSQNGYNDHTFGPGSLSPQISNSNYSGYRFSTPSGIKQFVEAPAQHESPSANSVSDLPLFVTPRGRPDPSALQPGSPNKSRKGSGLEVLEDAETNQPDLQIGPTNRSEISSSIETRMDNEGIKVGSIEQPKPSKRYTTVEGRKRITPIFICHIEKDRETKPPPSHASDGVASHKVPSAEDSYLEHLALRPEDIFYPEEPSDLDARVHVSSSDHPSGQKQYVARMIKHFLQQPAQYLSNSKARAKIPCSSSMVSDGDTRYFTMFAPGLEPAVHNVSHWPALTPRTLRRSPRSNKTLITPDNGPTGEIDLLFRGSAELQLDEEQYEYLLAKYPPKDDHEDVLALYGDSGDEGEYDQETWDEIQRDKDEASQDRLRAGTLSVVEIEALMDEATREFRSFWQERKLEKVQMKGYRLWMKAHIEGRRQFEIDSSLFWVNRFNNSIQKMREAIAKDLWHKATEVKQQCQSLEESIYRREEYEYFVTILSDNRPPVKPTVDVLKKPKKERSVTSGVPEGEEILESDSDPDLTGFISDDSSDVESIPHDQILDGGDTSKARSSENCAIDLPGMGKSALSQEQFRNEIFGALDSSTKEVSPALLDLTSNDDLVAGPEFAAGPDQELESSGNDIGRFGEEVIYSLARSRQLSQKTKAQAYTDDIASDHKVSDYQPRNVSTIDLSSDLSKEDSDLDQLPMLPNRRYSQVGRTVFEPLVLSSSPSPAQKMEEESSTEYEVHTPDLNPPKDSPVKKKLKINPPKPEPNGTQDSLSPPRIKLILGGPPALEDVEGIRGIAWDQLQENQDYHRVLAKVVYSLIREDAVKLLKYVQHVQDKKLGDLLTAGLSAIKNEQEEIEGVPQTQPRVRRLVRLLSLLFASYACLTDVMDEDRITDADLDEAFHERPNLLQSFSKCLRVVLAHYCGADTRKGKKMAKRKAAEVDADTDDKSELADDTDTLMRDPDDESDGHLEKREPSSIKKRKRKVAESQEALWQQRSDQLRVQEEERRKATMEKRLASMDITGDNPAGRAVTFVEPIIFLDPHIGRRIKPHQVGGVQFMWRELVNNPKQQGCLLAHTMGLGKTMQVISILVTIAQAAQSFDPYIRDQVPERLKKTITLILCPPSLIDNWYDELMMWRPHPALLGKLNKITSSEKQAHRLHCISSWASEGGVLMISYEMFRSLVLNDRKRLSDEEHKQIEADLLDSPNIIVADEAHKMKNAGSKLTMVAKRFKSTSRIALTGSPLANNLLEYHTMIDWIAPGYLGDMKQFKAKYSEPIEYGLYSDSTDLDRRTSLRKLHVLKRDLDPKIDRADITAIAQDMPLKTELYLTVPLTRLQVKAYNAYVDSLLKSDNSNSSGNARLWDWLAMLSLLCNHPSCFVHKLDERTYSTQAQAPVSPTKNRTTASTDEENGDSLPRDVMLSDVGLSRDMIEKELEIFGKFDDEGTLDDPRQSNRSDIVRQIIEYSIVIGDKVLVFSHSIPTLNFLENLLKQDGYEFCRIDGETKMSKRQETTKNFNKQDSKLQVFLISMRAGGLGLNLQGANRVIIYDFGFNPTWEEQAIGRAYRLGQDKPVYVYRFRAAGTFEEVMYNKAVFKNQLFQRVVDKKNPMRLASKQVSDYLFRVRNVDKRDVSEILRKDPDVLGRVSAASTRICNIELTETFQKEDGEILTTEERKQADEEWEDQQLERNDPVAFRRKQMAKRAAHTMVKTPVLQGINPGYSLGIPAHAQPGRSPSSKYPSTMTQAQAQAPPSRPSEHTFPMGTNDEQTKASLFAHRAPGPSSHFQHPLHGEISSAPPGLSSIQHHYNNHPRSSSAGPESSRLPQLHGNSDQYGAIGRYTTLNNRAEDDQASTE